MVEGLCLMGIGMATVFAFLGFLVAMMTFTSWVIQNYFPEEPEEAPGDQRAALVRVAVAMAAIEAKRRGGN